MLTLEGTVTEVAMFRKRRAPPGNRTCGGPGQGQNTVGDVPDTHFGPRQLGQLE
jgi:hypothetical protein